MVGERDFLGFAAGVFGVAPVSGLFERLGFAVVSEREGEKKYGQSIG